MTWMVNAYKSGLVPKGNINTTDYHGLHHRDGEEPGRRGAVRLLRQRRVHLQRAESSSSVVNQTEYIPTPGAAGVGTNVANPDGIGIPKTAKNVAGAVKFIKWFTKPRTRPPGPGCRVRRT